MKKLLFVVSICMPTVACTGAMGFLDAIASSSYDTEDYSPHSPRSRDRRQALAKKRSGRQYALTDLIKLRVIYLRNGTTINLARCNLISLQGLDELPNTTILNLADNPLIVLHKHQFDNLNMRNLKVLSLRNTLLDELTPEQCKGLENLEELDISRNYIHPQPDPQALGLKNLKKFTYEPQLTPEEAKKLGF